MIKFKINDRVSREIDIYDRSKGLKIGTIKRLYSKPEEKCCNSILSPYPELYGVFWDNRKYEEGFLPHGINAI